MTPLGRHLSRRRPWMIVGAIATVTTIATFAVAQFRSAGPLGLEQRIDVGGQPAVIQPSSGGIFVSAQGGIRRINPRNNRVQETIAGPDAFAFTFFDAAGGSLWVQQGGTTSSAPMTIVRIEEKTGSRREIAAYRGGPHGVTFATGIVWAVDIEGGLTKIDASSGDVLAQTSIGWAAWSVAVGEGAVWVAGSGGIARVDPSSAQVTAMIPVVAAEELAVGYGSVWAAGAISKGQRGVLRIDPRTNTIAGYTSIQGVKAVAAGLDAVWAVSDLPARLSKLHPTTGEVLETISTGALTPTDVAVGHGAVWVAECCLSGRLLRFE